MSRSLRSQHLLPALQGSLSSAMAVETPTEGINSSHHFTNGKKCVEIWWNEFSNVGVIEVWLPFRITYNKIFHQDKRGTESQTRDSTFWKWQITLIELCRKSGIAATKALPAISESEPAAQQAGQIRAAGLEKTSWYPNSWMVHPVTMDDFGATPPV